MMNKRFWIWGWIVMYVACVALGVFWPASVVSRLVGVLFFVPPAVLLWQGDEKLVKWVRIIAIASLTLTMLTIIVLFLTVGSKKDLDHLLEAVLLLVATPLKCFKSWLVSLFGWACLFSGSFARKKF